jgi:hypothetical protein
MSLFAALMDATASRGDITSRKSPTKKNRFIVDPRRKIMFIWAGALYVLKARALGPQTCTTIKMITVLLARSVYQSPVFKNKL